MRIALVIVALALPALPGAASADSSECRHLTQQIEHYRTLAERAEALDSELWEQRTEDHIERLVERRIELCPEYAKEDRTLAAFAHLMRIAGKAALSYFTFGAL